MRFDHVIPIHPAPERLLPMGRGVKMRLVMPAFHQRPNDPLRFAVGLRPPHFGKPLRYLGFQTPVHEGMRGGRAGPFPTVIGIPTLNGVGTFLLDLLQKRVRQQLSLIRQNRRKQLPREIVDRDTQVFFPLRARLALQHRQLPRVGMQHLARIVFVIAFRALLQPRFDRLCYLGQPFDAILQAAETLVRTVMHRKIPLPTAVQDFVNRGTTPMRGRRQISHPPARLIGSLVHLLALCWGQPGLFVNVHNTSVVHRLQQQESVNNARFSNILDRKEHTTLTS